MRDTPLLSPWLWRDLLTALFLVSIVGALGVFAATATGVS